MKARIWFHALGQSHEARGVPYIPQRIGMQAWPHWAKQAYCAGRLSVQHAGFGERLTRTPRNLRAPAHPEVVVITKDSIASYVQHALERKSQTLRNLLTIKGLERELRALDPEATARLVSDEYETIEVVSTIHPEVVRAMVPLSVKVNCRYRGTVKQIVIETTVKV